MRTMEKKPKDFQKLEAEVRFLTHSHSASSAHDGHDDDDDDDDHEHHGLIHPQV